jgi:hypothetical protein
MGDVKNTAKSLIIREGRVMATTDELKADNRMYHTNRHV